MRMRVRVSYANSFDLYAGNGSFDGYGIPKRETWLLGGGMSELCLIPGAHLYSLVRSGLEAEDYLGPYWRSRGRPRFYRYLVDTRTPERLSRPLSNSLGATASEKVRACERVAVGEGAVGEEVAEAEKPARPHAAIEASERTPVMAAHPERLAKTRRSRLLQALRFPPADGRAR